MAKAEKERPVVAQNRRARHEYFINETMEAGLSLTGTEVKSLRTGKSNIADAYAGAEGDELFLLNAHIPEYSQGNRFNHEPRRKRKLLLHRRQVNRLIGAIQRKGVTLVPLSIYFNESGRAKVELAVVSGKKKYDKRATEKDRDWQRDKARLIRNRGKE